MPKKSFNAAKGCLLSSLSLLLTACSPANILSYTSGAADYRIETDVAYGEDDRHKLDIYQGKNSQCRIVFVYGGGWTEGEKEEYGFVGAALAKRGYEVVIPNYRLYPEVRHPVFVEDIALSLKFLNDQRPSELPLVIMGHSAGAMIGSMVSYDPSYLEAHNLNTDIIDANIAISGPHDYFLPTNNPKWTAIFGEDPTQQIDGLVVNHIQPGAPKSLIMHGTDDTVVTVKSATSITEKLRAVNTPVELKLYEDIGHVKIIAALGSPLRFLAPTLDDIDHYLSTEVCHRKKP